MFFNLEENLLQESNSPTMICVKWISFILDKSDRTTFIGRVRLIDWNTWPS